MFNKLIDMFKGGLAKLGIIKTLKSISDHKDIGQNDGMFKLIEKWNGLYQGTDKDYFNIQVQTISGKKDRRLRTLGLPKVMSNEMASLIFNERCEINIDDDQVKEFVDDVFKRNKFNKNFQDYLEYSFAIGGMVIKPYFDGEKVMLSFVSATNFVPISWKNGNIYEAVFTDHFVEKDKHLTHLEWHLWESGVYVVKNELYKSDTSDSIGRKVALGESPKTENLVDEAPIRNLNQSLFTYFRPNTANNFDMSSPLGISIFANAMDTLEAVDTAFDSFHREFRLGKKRILVPAEYIKTVIDPTTGNAARYFDDTDETYEAFRSEIDSNSGIKDISVELRVEEHIAGINALLNLLAMQTGFSTGTFTFDGQSMKTATEVVSENSKTFKSKQSHETIIDGALTELVGSIITLAELYELGSFTDEYEVEVKFDDSIAEDKQSDINQQVQLVSAELQSKKRAIMKIFKVTEQEADEIVAEINQEQQATAPQEAAYESVLFGSQE